jgi:secreted Zn-dependent insulinase-like peptidase
MKPKEFKVKTLEDFQLMIDEKHFSISEAVVNAILNNLKTRKKRIHMLSVKCTDENAIFDITLEKNNFVDTLKENLKYFEERELYEECAKIHEGIKVLSNVK